MKWKKTAFDTRKEIATRYAALVEKEKDTLALTISQEMGKPLWESLQEVQSMVHKVAISIQAIEARYNLPKRQIGSCELLTKFHPHGVVAVFGPFNFPGHLPNGHIVPALLAGNTILFKPSEHTPRVGEIMCKLWEQAGLPEGVLTLVQGDKEVAIQIASLPEVQAIFFTGSVEAGRSLTKQSLDFPGRILALEMGGNNPLVVSSISDIAATVYTIVQSAYLTSGQRCSAARRLILIEKSNTDALLSALIKTIKSLTVGPYTDTPEPYMGPTLFANRVHSAYETLIQSGGTPLVEMHANGNFLTPALIDVTGIKTQDEEIFGPLLQCIRVKTLEEAIHVANATSYGLTAGILTDSRAEFLHFYEEAEAGIINWNVPLTGASSLAPFGGIKKSGNGRPSGYLACDYCAYPVASMEQEAVRMPEKLPPGMRVVV